MSEKFSARNNSCSVSPLRTNTFVGRCAVNPNKTTSKRHGAKKTGEKIIEEKKNEGRNNREEFGTGGLNLTLVGSPAPRSQVRALVSSSNLVAKSKIKPAYSSKSREQNPHEICMEKLYQFADNPTKFVRLENREESKLQLDLEFSDRSEESENFYNSHNIAFGEKGEYRIPEYDHIRFLQFSIGDNQDPRIINEDRDNTSASVKFDRSTATGVESSNTPIDSDLIYDRFAKGNQISTIPDAPESRGSLDLSENGPQIDEINPWNLKSSHTSNWAALQDTAQSYPLGSAINYKNNINPEVEKFMLLDTGPESMDENYTKSTQNNRLIDESILSKNFSQAVRVQPFEGSGENSSRTSPLTSRTTLSQASSVDGTWHGHSLNSPYFASIESSSWTDSKKNVDKDLSKVITSYDESDEYLTIVKNEENPLPDGSPDKGGVQRYIFITNQFLGSELQSNRSLEGADDRCHRDNQNFDNSLTRLAVTESGDNSSTKLDRLQSTQEIGKLVEDLGEDISSPESSSDYCIGNIFSRSSSSYITTSSSSTSSSSSSASNEDVRRKGIGTSSSLTTSFGDKIEIQEDENNSPTANCSVPDVKNSNLLKENSRPKILYMTLEEVNLAADYSNKLSAIFNRVLKRSEYDNQAKNPKEVKVTCSISEGATPQNTSKSIHTCLESANFCSSHFSS